MIDLDMAKALYMFSKGITVNDDTIALDLISKLEFCHSETYLTSDLTLDHYGEFLWLSDMFGRSSLNLNGEKMNFDEENDKIFKRAYDKYYSLPEKAPVYEAPKHFSDEAEKIVEFAKKEILGGSTR